MQIRDIIVDSVAAFMRGIGDFLPNILAAILILIVGWIIAKLLKAAVARGLKLVKFGTLTQRAGIDEFLAKGDVKQSPGDLIAVLVYWLVMLIVLVTAVNALGLEVASQLLNQILLYIPNIIVAVIVVVVGLYAANFVAALVKNRSRQCRDHGSGTRSRAVALRAHHLHVRDRAQSAENRPGDRRQRLPGPAGRSSAGRCTGLRPRRP